MERERERECDSAAFPQALVAALKATSSSALQIWQIWQVPPQCKSCCAKPASKGEAHTLPVRRWTCTGSHTEISKSVHGQASTLDRKQNVFRSSRSLRTGSLNLPQNLKAPTPSHNCALARLELQVYSSKCLQLGQRSLQVLSKWQAKPPSGICQSKSRAHCHCFALQTRTRRRTMTRVLLCRYLSFSQALIAELQAMVDLQTSTSDLFRHLVGSRAWPPVFAFFRASLHIFALQLRRGGCTAPGRDWCGCEMRCVDGCESSVSSVEVRETCLSRC